MKDVFLNYQAMLETGDIKITAGYDPKTFVDEDYEGIQELKKIKTSELILKLLEEIQSKTNMRFTKNQPPCYFNNPDSSPDSYRSISYLPTESWTNEAFGDTVDPAETKKSEDKNSGRHSRIHPIFKGFIISYNNTY